MKYFQHVLPFTPEELPPYVKVKKSTRARRMALRLDVKERLFHLVVPRGMSLKKAQEFAEGHDKWMREKLNTLPKPVNFKNGSTVPVLGRCRTIRIVYSKDLKTTDILLKYNEILVFTNQRNPAARIQRFLKDLAKETLTEMAERKAALIRRKVKSVRVRDTKSRWGSCAEDGCISFSWRLILAPYEAMDYVVAHEVAHLVHMDHSKNFWNLCRKLSDNFIEGEYWMAQHAQELMRYGQKPGYNRSRSAK